MKVLQVVGYKNAGKTTLAEQIIARLAARGLQVAAIKHDAHDAEPDSPGTDTWRHRHAGATTAALVSGSRTMWIREKPAPLAELIAACEAEGMDAAVVEGFKTAAYPKIVLLRGEQDKELLTLPGIVAAVHTNASAASVDSAPAAGYPTFAAAGFAFESVLDFVERRLWYNGGQESRSEVE